MQNNKDNLIIYRLSLYFYNLQIFLKMFYLFLQVKERPDVGVYVKDLSAYVVNNADDMDKTMNIGNKNSKLEANKWLQLLLDSDSITFQ